MTPSPCGPLAPNGLTETSFPPARRLTCVLCHEVIGCDNAHQQGTFCDPSLCYSPRICPQPPSERPHQQVSNLSLLSPDPPPPDIPPEACPTSPGQPHLRQVSSQRKLAQVSLRQELIQLGNWGGPQPLGAHHFSGQLPGGLSPGPTPTALTSPSGHPLSRGLSGVPSSGAHPAMGLVWILTPTRFPPTHRPPTSQTPQMPWSLGVSPWAALLHSCCGSDSIPAL